jgi:hypothetical protein
MYPEAQGQGVFNQGREDTVALRNNEVVSEFVRGVVFFGLIMPALVAGMIIAGNLFY